ncbi:MAG TPA: glycosyl hydrolase [Terriglobales bacterium]|nr:glycosyl hydrolase [Terriglobales bacterium]
MRKLRQSFVTALLLLSLGVFGFAQKPPKAAKAKAEVQKQQSEKKAEAATPEDKNSGAKKDESKPKDPMSTSTFNGLKLRLIGPAVTSGRVIAFAVNPENRAEYYVGVASGGVWKTTNNGTTWTPVFDGEGSYSIGAVTLDPKDPAVVWVGTGENNSQRSVAWGDGVYKSEDGGKSWKNVGLKKSEHIGRILIDPRDSKVVYVASQGPLWGPGGDRGLFKTTDAGKTWKNVLEISENTGVTDIAFDPENPDVIYAASYQRRRHVWTMIGGGPESALYKSTDAGANWTKLKSGLPTEDIGRIGIAVAPTEPNIVYAQIEAANGKGGIFRSTDRGATWERRNPYDSTGQYYSRITVDPKNAERVYIMGVYPQVSDDGGKTFRRMNIRSVHVDVHELWVDPNDTNYYLTGCDGGVYESYDRGESWAFKPNLPITQFYDVTVDNAKPFYNVYAGTQDNNSLGGPSRTRNINGIMNQDWFITSGGDGFRSQVDPVDPNTVYAEAQYGGLVRFDRRTGEELGIQPQPGRGEPPLRWNWDSPLIISPHSHTRLYFAANKLFRSDDRGNTWKAISGDLTRQLDRNRLPVMGKVWPADAVAKNASTSFYGNIVALSESPKQDGLLYVGTDDGLIQVTENGGQTWTKYEKFTGVPDQTYISRLAASAHDANTVYASFEAHKNADFKPYLLKSTDRGKTWTNIASNLPENGPVLAIAEDTVNPNLLFAGTEFGLFFTIDGGKTWTQLKGDFPTIAVRDLVIQPREGDLVVATFGRGIYILDDITPLRVLKPEMLAQEAVTFPVKDTLLYVEARPLGGRRKAFMGEQFYIAPNPPYGVTFTYYLKDKLKTKKEQRQEAERETVKKGQTPPYPTPEQLRAEAEAFPPQVYMVVYDASGKAVRTVPAPITEGMHRVSWNFRHPAPQLPPETGEGDEDFFWGDRPSGPLAMPGKYTAKLFKKIDGVVTELGSAQHFTVYTEESIGMKPEDLAALNTFQQKAARLYRAVTGAVHTAEDTKSRLKAIRRALHETPAADHQLAAAADKLENQLNEIQRSLRGDVALAARNENVGPSIQDRIRSVLDDTRFSIAVPTQTHRDAYAIAAQEFSQELTKLRGLIEGDLVKLEKGMEAAGAPWTPGRIPEWSPEE